MTVLGSTTLSGYVDVTYHFALGSAVQTAATRYYATIRGRFRPGLGNPVLVLQRIAARPIAVHTMSLPWGRRTIITSAIAGEIRYTLNGSQPTVKSRRYLHPILRPIQSTMRVGVFQGGQLVAEALVFPKIEMLERNSSARAPRGRVDSQRDQEILTEVNRELLRLGGIPPLFPATPLAGEVLIEVNRAVLQQGGSPNALPPLPPTSLTTPEDRPRIVVPPPPSTGP